MNEKTENPDGSKMPVRVLCLMTRPAYCIFRLAADAGRSGVEGGVAASTLFYDTACEILLRHGS